MNFCHFVFGRKISSLLMMSHLVVIYAPEGIDCWMIYSRFQNVPRNQRLSIGFQFIFVESLMKPRKSITKLEFFGRLILPCMDLHSEGARNSLTLDYRRIYLSEKFQIMQIHLNHLFVMCANASVLPYWGTNLLNLSRKLKTHNF